MSECRGELLLKVRRGLVSDQERIALDAHLSTCAHCSALHEYGSAFDAAGQAHPEDALVVARIAQAVIPLPPSPFPSPPRNRWAPWVGKVAVGLTVSSLAAAAALWSAPKHPAREPSTQESPLLEPKGQTSPRAPVALEPTQARSAAVPAPVQPQVSRPQALPVPSAAELFRDANRARHRGENEKALGLYQELLVRYPRSAQATTGGMTLGSLLLAEGRARPALARFDQYLASGQSALRPEALYGRARALGALGRVKEEEQAWAQLVRSYPTSTYATMGRRRLETVR